MSEWVTLPSSMALRANAPDPLGRLIGPRGSDSRPSNFQSFERLDLVTLEAGATFAGNYTLPNKSGAGWIIIRTSAPDASLPPPGTRITPAYAAALPKVISPNASPAIATQAGAHHYRLIGLEVTVGAGVTSNEGVGGLIRIGEWAPQTTLDQVPHDIILDRVYVHGTPAVTLRRCIALNGASVAVIDSYITDAHHRTFDTH